MTISKAHHYAPIVRGSNYAPLTIELRDARTSRHLDLTGAEVTITILDETTGDVIVEAGEAVANETFPYWIEYHLTDLEAAKITKPSTWIAQWSLTAGNGRKWFAPIICRIPVRPSVL